MTESYSWALGLVLVGFLVFAAVALAYDYWKTKKGEKK